MFSFSLDALLRRGSAGDDAGSAEGAGAGSGSAGSGAEPLEWKEPLLGLAQDVARGMAYLHGREYLDEADGTRKRGVIHRDLKVT